MHIQPWMIETWAVVSAALVIVMVYRATLTQHETDRLFLGDEDTLCASHVEHRRLLTRVHRLRPLYQGLTGATILMSALIAGLYVAEVWPTISFHLQ